jgi:peptide-methionine (R)-S-oxide reductase
MVGAVVASYLCQMMKKAISRRSLLAALPVSLVAGCSRGSPTSAQLSSGEPQDFTDSTWRALSEADWKLRLSEQEFEVLRLEATERAFTSPLNEEKRKGVFVCAGCALPLFRSEKKYDSGTGWPSFFDVIEGAVGTKPDNKLWMTRTEYHCARCLGHQGHVFKDGPPPTGLRYCNNGVALDFVPDASS